MVSVKKSIEQDAERNFERIANGLLKSCKVTYEFRSEVGFIQDRVQDHLRKNNILIFVIGKKLAFENKEVLDQLMEQTDVPLAIIPEKVSIHDQKENITH
jgi:hypothetical protein